MSNASSFDPSTFLDATISEPSVKRPPLPAGKDFEAEIGEVKVRSWTGKVDPSKSGMAADVPIKINIEAYPDIMATLGGLKEVTIVDGIMLDITPTGSIDNAPGKNAKLRRYREALNLNKEGDTFSFRRIQGMRLRVKIKHDPYEGDVYDKIDSVAKL